MLRGCPSRYDREYFYDIEYFQATNGFFLHLPSQYSHPESNIVTSITTIYHYPLVVKQ